MASLERAGLVERRPHPTHGRIREVFLTPAGQGRLDAATPAVKALEKTIEAGHTDAEIRAVKAWLVESARRMEGIKQDSRERRDHHPRALGRPGPSRGTCAPTWRA